MKKIILPTDFSDNSYNAIKYALQLFKDEECTFYLLNTYTPAIYYVEYILVTPQQYGLSDAIRDKALKGLYHIVEKVKKQFNNPKHQFRTIAAFNTLIQEIEEMIKENDIDYIVMGTKGATGAKEILFGSNTVQVLKHVRRPVLAVPVDFEFEPLHEVLFPTDYDINYRKIEVEPIIDLATSFPSRVNILNVSYGYDLSEIQEKNKQKLDTYFKKITHLFHRVSNQTVPEAITNFQLKARINMLIMINNKHSFFENLFFENTINQIGFHLNIPFLVIPSTSKNK